MGGLCSACSGLGAASELPHPGSQPAQARHLKTGCRDLSVLRFRAQSHRGDSWVLSRSLEPRRELAWGLQQQGSLPQPFRTERWVQDQVSTSHPWAQAKCPISMASTSLAKQGSYQGLTDRL